MYALQRNKKNVYNNLGDDPVFDHTNFKDRTKSLISRNNSRRYWAQNKLDVSDIPGAQVDTATKYKWHLKGADSNLNVGDIVPNINKRSVSRI